MSWGEGGGGWKGWAGRGVKRIPNKTNTPRLCFFGRASNFTTRGCSMDRPRSRQKLETHGPRRGQLKLCRTPQDQVGVLFSHCRFENVLSYTGRAQPSPHRCSDLQEQCPAVANLASCIRQLCKSPVASSDQALQHRSQTTCPKNIVHV